MKIGIDIHGTIDSNVSFFKESLKTIIENGDHVVIISGPPTLQIKKELDEFGLVHNVHYNNIISVVDFLKNNATKMWQDDNGNWWCNDEIWWKSKYRICLMYNIDVLIDDKVEYKEHFKNSSTVFGLWNPEDNSVCYEISEPEKSM